MNANTKRMLFGMAIIGLGVYALMSVMDVWDASGRLESQQSDLAEVQQKLKEIDEVSEAPKVAALDVESPDEIVNRINRALDQAGLSTAMLSNHTPNAPVPIKKSDFTTRTVDITLKPASIAKIVAFCEALRDEATGSVVRDLRLYEPRKSGREEIWASQMVLTQIIFSPKSES